MRMRGGLGPISDSGGFRRAEDLVLRRIYQRGRIDEALSRVWREQVEAKDLAELELEEQALRQAELEERENRTSATAQTGTTSTGAQQGRDPQNEGRGEEKVEPSGRGGYFSPRGRRRHTMPNFDALDVKIEQAKLAVQRRRSLIPRPVWRS